MSDQAASEGMAGEYHNFGFVNRARHYGFGATGSGAVVCALASATGFEYYFTG